MQHNLEVFFMAVDLFKVREESFEVCRRNFLSHDQLVCQMQLPNQRVQGSLRHHNLKLRTLASAFLYKKWQHRKGRLMWYVVTLCVNKSAVKWKCEHSLIKNRIARQSSIHATE